MDYLSRRIYKKFLTICAIWMLLDVITFTKVARGDSGIYPMGTIEKRVGEEVNIICWINERGKNASNLSFHYNEGQSKPVPRESISIYNETAIQFTIRNAPKMVTMYICKIDGKDGVNLSKVVVGTAPQKVTDFKCVSYDFEYLVCNFTAPENYIRTSYTLYYTILQQDYNCTSFIPKDDGVYTCIISNESYRYVHKIFLFHLKARNTFGTLTQNFSINNYDVAIPPKPKLIITNVTSNSVTFEWQFLKIAMYRETGLTYEVKIMSSYENWRDVPINPMGVNGSAFRATIQNLHYPYTWYDIRMRVKVSTARDDGTMWSDAFNGTFRTSSVKPYRPPKTDSGSFYIDQSGNAHLYWEALKPFEENGNNIKYIITSIKRNNVPITDLEPTEINDKTAKFDLKLHDLNDEYEFVIKSKNDVGESPDGSIIHIPRRHKDLFEEKKPQFLRKIYHQQKYNLSWMPPKDTTDLMNYSVYRCISKIESFHQCQESILIEHVDKFRTNITHQQIGSSTMNFAVAANYKNFSSGMVWAKCTALPTSDFDKMYLTQNNVGPTSINISWNVECVDSSILEGYHLVYCPIKEPSRVPECREQAKKITIPKNAKDFTISDLKPHTIYLMNMTMFSSKKRSPNNTLQVTTLDAAPTPPRNLTYTNLTNTTVDLIWTVPESMNGILNYYEITYNGKTEKVERDQISNSTIIEYTLRGLRSYYDYTVYVTASSSHLEPSNSSNVIMFRTLVGIPGEVGSTNHTNINSKLTLYWEPPAKPSGKLDFYEILSMRKGRMLESNVISRVRGTRCRVRRATCLDSSHNFQFSVRAVNVIEKSKSSYHTFTKRDTSDASKYIELEGLMEADVVIVREAPIYKRHSHGEVDLFDLEIHSGNHIRHNRQERDDVGSSQLGVYQRPLGEYGDDVNDLKCEEDDPQLEKLVEMREKHEFLRGPWKALPSSLCFDADDSKQKIIYVFGVLISLVSVIVFYFCGQKYKRMKNIDVVLPPGLTDLDQEVQKGVDNIISKHEIMRSDEYIYKNENHHLLAGSGNDSGFLHDMNCSDKSDSYDMSDPMKEEEHGAQSDSVELSDMSNSSNASPAESPNVQRSDKIMSSDVSPVIINGYVQPQKLSVVSPSGYTTLDAFGKPILPPINTVSTEPKCKEPGINENICGYVTHKQLSDFGHRLQ